MKIVVTGSLGHISKPLAQALIQKGHSVSVVSSNPAKQQEIQALGARAAIGDLNDVDFLTNTFSGADAVYVMIPPVSFFDLKLDLMAFVQHMADQFQKAIQRAGVKRVIHLSSIGAHTDQNNGMLKFHYNVEQTLRQLPVDVSIKHLRPVGFYYNLLSFVPAVKTQGVMASNFGADDLIPWVSPLDIAEVAAEEFDKPFEGRTVRYVASDEVTCQAVASAFGTAIGKPDLKWIVIPPEQLQSRLISVGMNPAIAEGYVQMNEAQHRGDLFDDYYRHRPVLGRVKIADFAKEFAARFNQE